MGMLKAVTLALILVSGGLVASRAEGTMFMTAGWKKRVAGDPCAGTPAAGTQCSGGAYFAGSYNGFKYMTTPAGCGPGVSPTCGNDDTVFYLQWGASGTLTPATSTTDGAANTSYLAANFSDTDAAKHCENLVLFGYSDWFLPSTLEATNTLYTNKASMPGLILDGSNYWTSVDSTATKASLIRFNTGTVSTTTKSGLYYVRCVRKY